MPRTSSLPTRAVSMLRWRLSKTRPTLNSYFRLSHSRSLKESYRFAIWQAQTFLGESPPTVVDADKGFEDFAKAQGGLVAMRPIGKAHTTKTQNGVSHISADNSGKTWKVQFDTLNLAQIPSFLLISAPKLTDSYTMESQFKVAADNANGIVCVTCRAICRCVKENEGEA